MSRGDDRAQCGGWVGGADSGCVARQLIVIRTGWFRNHARQEIISLTEDSNRGQSGN